MENYETPSEIFAAEALACDESEWIVFDPKRYPTPEIAREAFEKWLCNNLPSQTYRQNGIGWISVCSPVRTYSESDEGDPYTMIEEWEQINSSARPINYTTVKHLAMAHGVRSGKWLVFVKTGLKADHYWNIIARGIVEGRFGSSAKISPCCLETANYKHVICVYSDDFTDEEDVFKLENDLRGAGLKCTLKYKPDAFTYLGIYRQNKWNIKPFIYFSVYHLKTRSSEISGSS